LVEGKTIQTMNAPLAPPTVVVEDLNRQHFLRRYTFVNFGVPGVQAARTLDAAQPFYEQMLATGLPFRVAVWTELMFSLPSEEHPRPYHRKIPQISVSDGYGSSYTWAEFVQILENSLVAIVENLHNLPSGCVLEEVVSLRLLFIAGTQINAFIPHLRGGGKYVALPIALENKHACVNIQNLKGYDCFLNCVTCHLKGFYKPVEEGGASHPYLWNLYLEDKVPGGRKAANWLKDFVVKPLVMEGLDISCIPNDRPMPIELISTFEKLNHHNFGIYVYEWRSIVVDDVETEWPMRLRAPQRPCDDEILLLLYDGHYVYIKNLQRLASRQRQHVRHGHHHSACFKCYRCGNGHDNEENLRAHLDKKKCLRHDKEVASEWVLPELLEDGTAPVKKFLKHNHRFFHPCVVYADKEDFWAPLAEETRRGQNTNVVGHNVDVASIAYIAVGRGYQPPSQLETFLDRTEDAMREFFRRLFILVRDFQLAKLQPEPIKMSEQDLEEFAAAEACYLCMQPFDADRCKVRDHCHWSGQFRGTACPSCNGIAQNPRDIRIFFHNFGRYDSHGIIRFIAKLRNTDLTVVQFVARNGFEDDDARSFFNTKLSELNLEIVPRSGENMRQLKFGPLTFLDSVEFVKESLAKIIESHKKGKDDLTVAFPRTVRHHPALRETESISEDLGLLVRKLPFPYSALRDWASFDREAVLPQHEYDNGLSGEKCDDTMYEDCHLLARKFHWHNFGDVHDAYLWNDVLLYADCMEAWRQIFYDTSEIDPFHSMTLPSASEQGIFLRLLKENGPDFGIDLITDEELMRDVMNNIRGGLSCPFVAYEQANHPVAPWYDSSAPQTRLCYVDKNSLYSEAMSQALPTGEYRMLDLMDDEQQRITVVQHLANRYDEDGLYGYLCVIDYEIPECMHDRVDFAPVCKMGVPWSELSKRQVLKAEQTLYADQMEHYLRLHPGETTHAITVKEPKPQIRLVPWLGKHVRVAVHIANIKLMRELFQIDVLKVHTVWRFKQAKWLEKTFASMTAARSKETDEMKKDSLKIQQNSFYGKCLQNQLEQGNVNYYTDIVKWSNATWKRNMLDYDIYYHNNVTGEFLGWVSFAKPNGVKLTTLRLQGLVTLEWSKLLMQRLHYFGFKHHFGSLCKLLFTDTDSFIYLLTLTKELLHRFGLNHLEAEDVQTEHILAAINKEWPLFDLSKAGDNTYKGVLGFAKLEVGGDQVLLSYCGGQPKMYALLIACMKEGLATEMKAKGLPKTALKKTCTWDDYVQAVFHRNLPSKPVKFMQIRTRNHLMEHLRIQKRGISANNVSVYQLGPFHSRPLGHKKNYLSDAAEEDRDELWVQPKRARM